MMFGCGLCRGLLSICMLLVVGFCRLVSMCSRLDLLMLLGLRIEIILLVFRCNLKLLSIVC